MALDTHRLVNVARAQVNLMKRELLFRCSVVGVQSPAPAQRRVVMLFIRYIMSCIHGGGRYFMLYQFPSFRFVKITLLNKRL